LLECRGAATWQSLRLRTAVSYYRLIVREDGNRVRVFTRRGFDWTGKYPAITIALKLLRVRSVTIDGEAVYCSSAAHC
jgi:ATP-dependent DNA ligase